MKDATEGTAAARHCTRCGEILAGHVLAGQCSRCLGATAFAEEDSGEWTGSDQLPRRFGDYELLEEVGRGGMGIVYRAFQTKVGREVALKLLPGGDFAHPEFRKHLRREARAAGQLQHPNIVAVHDAGEHEQVPFYTMDLVRGCTLAGLIFRQVLSPLKAAEYLRAVAHAVQYAHDAGILHRDLKPANILVDSSDQPRLTDFGLARPLHDEPALTLTGNAAGSPAYMSPEQALGRSAQIGPRADIYSLGAILYHCVTGRPVFQGETVSEILLQLRDAEPVSPRQLDRRIPADIETICLKCLERDPARRYSSARELAEELERFERGAPIRARPISSREKLVRLACRHRLVSSLIVLVAVLLVAVAVVSTVSALRVAEANQTERAQRQRTEAVNAKLRSTIHLHELWQAEDAFARGDAGAGLARIAAVLREDPQNRIAAERLVSALVHRNWALPMVDAIKHSARVDVLVFSPDGKLLLTGGRDATTRISATSDGKMISEVRHGGDVVCAAFDGAGSRIATGAADGIARIWNLDGTPSTPELRHDGPVVSAEFGESGEVLATAARNGSVRLWGSRSGNLQWQSELGDSPITVARLAQNNGLAIAVGCASGELYLFRTDSKRRIALEGHSRSIQALAFDSTGRTLASAGEDGTVRLWNVLTGKELTPPLDHWSYRPAIWHVALSRDDRMILSTGEDASARVWDVPSGRSMSVPLQHDGGVRHGEFSQNGELIITASMDNSARIWATKAGAPISQPLREREAMVKALFSPGGRQVATACWDGTAQLWDFERFPSPGRDLAPGAAVRFASFAPDGKAAVTVSSNGVGRVWNAGDGTLVKEIFSLNSQVAQAAASQEGALISIAESGETIVWNIHAAAPDSYLLRAESRVIFAAFSPDSRQLVTVSTNGVAQVWDAARPEKPLRTLAHAGIRQARFGPDGNKIATASTDGTTQLWMARTGRAIAGPLRHGARVEWFEFSPDGRRLVTASLDDTASVWDAETGARVSSPLRHLRTVHRARFSPDGKTVLTASLDHYARLWDAATGRPVAALKHPYAVSDAIFSPDGDRVLTTCWNATVRIWDAQTGAPMTEAFWLRGFISTAEFDPSGDRIIVGTLDGTARIFDVPSLSLPVPEWLPGFAEAVAGMRFDANRNLEIITRAEFQQRREEARSKKNDGFYSRLGSWFLADPFTRARDPY